MKQSCSGPVKTVAFSVPTAALHLAIEVAVFGRTSRVAEAWMAWLRNMLVYDAAEILLDEHVIVSVENNARAVVYQQLMNRLAPSGPTLVELVFTRRTFATPFPEWGRFFAASLIPVAAAHEMM